jgi:hypothetical protein
MVYDAAAAVAYSKSYHLADYAKRDYAYKKTVLCMTSNYL